MKPSRFQSFTVLSAEVVASCWQSGLMRHLRMNCVWAFSLWRGSKCVVREAPGNSSRGLERVSHSHHHRRSVVGIPP